MTDVMDALLYFYVVCERTEESVRSLEVDLIQARRLCTLLLPLIIVKRWPDAWRFL